jgi:hypothetical protein
MGSGDRRFIQSLTDKILNRLSHSKSPIFLGR